MIDRVNVESMGPAITSSKHYSGARLLVCGAANWMHVDDSHVSNSCHRNAFFVSRLENQWAQVKRILHG